MYSCCGLVQQKKKLSCYHSENIIMGIEAPSEYLHVEELFPTPRWRIQDLLMIIEYGESDHDD